MASAKRSRVSPSPNFGLQQSPVTMDRVELRATLEMLTETFGARRLRACVRRNPLLVNANRILEGLERNEQLNHSWSAPPSIPTRSRLWPSCFTTSSSNPTQVLFGTPAGLVTPPTVILDVPQPCPPPPPPSPTLIFQGTPENPINIDSGSDSGEVATPILTLSLSSAFSGYETGDEATF